MLRNNPQATGGTTIRYIFSSSASSHTLPVTKEENTALSTELDNLPNDICDKTDPGNSQFLTLAFLSLCLFLKSAGIPLQNISNSEAELMGRKRQTQDTAGSLAEMLSWSITEKLEIKFRISFKNKFCKSSAQFGCPVEANRIQDSGEKIFLCSSWSCYNPSCNQNVTPQIHIWTSVSKRSGKASFLHCLRAVRILKDTNPLILCLCFWVEVNWRE